MSVLAAQMGKKAEAGPFSGSLGADGAQSYFASDGIRSEALLPCFDAFSSCELGTTWLENALTKSAFLGAVLPQR